AALASTADGKPGTHSKKEAVTVKRGAESDSDLAARLGVSPERLDQALRATKISLSKANAKPTEARFVATLARMLGIPDARVRQAFPVGRGEGSKAAGSKAAKETNNAATRATNAAFAAAVARELNISTARVKAALRPLFAAGSADPTSPVFAAAARSLGVSGHQLYSALVHAKESLAQLG
ncbi:MAG: hypothetical protein LBV34_02540, partial [Nocardiopsaceae bacterium]|nr:hypothetical protein [Nocardiopsaceae bacterium]